MAASSSGADRGRREMSALMSRRTQAIPPPPALEPAGTNGAGGDAPEPTSPAATTTSETPGRVAESNGQEPVEAGRAAGGGRPAASPRGRSARRPSPRPRAAALLPDDQTRPVPAYLPADLRAEVLRVCRANGLTLAEWLLDTYDRVFERLDATYGAGPEAAAPRRSGLPPRRTRRRNDAVSVQMQFGLTGAELRVLEEHMARLEVGSRSEFFTVIAQMGLDR